MTKGIRTLRTPQPSSFRADGIELHAPASWQELTQNQLRYVFFLLATFGDHVQVKTYMFLRFTGLVVEKKIAGGVRCHLKDDKKKRAFNLSTWQVQSLIHVFDYIDSYDGMGVRLERIQRYHAVDALLHGLPFVDYLNCEVIYQAFLRSKDPERLNALAKILYRDNEDNPPEQLVLTPTEQTATLIWYTSVKLAMSKAFPHFFKPSGSNESPRLMELMNAQLRALTEGDVTKEAMVEELDCWRCLTELDAKAREAQEFERKYGNK
jgi:hypothetical protein